VERLPTIRGLGLLFITLAAALSGCGDAAKTPNPPHLAADYRGTPARVGGCSSLGGSTARTSSSPPPDKASSRGSGRE
jgi:hypothetical protein